jgi:molybdopterin molybdotransferase
MDGYAIRGEETTGADPYAPAVFQVVGRARPGRPFAGEVGPGEAVQIATGAPLPTGADAVVKVESTRLSGEWIEVFEATPPLRNVGQAGEDLATGALALPAGRILRPQDLGILSALGCQAVAVVRRPRVAIVLTGDELLPPGAAIEPHRIPDMNGPMLAALVTRDGGLAEIVGPLPDERATLRRELVRLSSQYDCLLVSGGSSTGPEDHAPTLVAELGQLVFHGVALRPASPAGFGQVADAPVFLLPGNPVSCLCAYDFLASRAIRGLGGRGHEWPYRSIERPLRTKLVSALGRTDYTRVRLVADEVEPLSTSGASILSSTSRADGFVVVPEESEGLAAGSRATVWLYDLEPGT